MCGLYGAAGDLNVTTERVVRILAVLDSLRGEDSTGVAFIHKFTDTTAVVKEVGNPFNLIESGKYEAQLKKQHRAIIGHNRYATTGAVNRANAHPFVFDTLIGVHNGTLASKWKLPNHMDFKVDSQALFNTIEEDGLKRAIAPLGGMGNAWSLVWWDMLDSTLNFLRNKERPMFMARTDDGKQLYWASEQWMLSVALNRCGVKHGEVFSTDEDTHYSVHIDNKGVMHKPRVEVVKADEIVHVPVVKQQDYRKPPHVNMTKGDTTKTTTGQVVPFSAAASAEVLKSKLDTAIKELADLDSPAKGAEVKKPQVPAKQDVLASDPSYVSSTKRTFETLCACRDGNGGRYLSLFDPNEPNIDIRLYPHKLDWVLLDMEGEEITGAVQSYCNKGTDHSAERGYYKVSPWTVSYEGAIGDDEEMTVMDHKGKLITETQFKETYPSCGWCGDALSLLNKNRYTTMGDCFCPECAKNEDVTQHVNLL